MTRPYTEVVATAPDGTVTRGVGWSGENPPPVSPPAPYSPSKISVTLNGVEFEDKGSGIDIENIPVVRGDARTLPDIKFTVRLRGAVHSVVCHIPLRLVRHWRRQKRMELRRRRGRGACSA